MPGSSGCRNVHELGEFGLISLLSEHVVSSGAGIRLGIGDDAAALDIPGNDYLLAATDMFVDGVHFTSSTTDPLVLGRRLFAVNASDIAAMGGKPTGLLVSLALPPDSSVDFLAAIYDGLQFEASRVGAGILGGNITRIEGPMCLDVTMIGLAPKHALLRRRGARAGDALAVTGALGTGAAVRWALAHRDVVPDDLLTFAVDRAVPQARLSEAATLAGEGLAHAAMDLSDGLAGDLVHLAQQSAVGARIDTSWLPIEPDVLRIAELMGVDPVELAMSGGEDYELLVAVPHDRVPDARRATTPTPLTVIGSVLPPADGISLVHLDGGARPLSPDGWRHF